MKKTLKVISVILPMVLLTSCMPSGNLVGKASFSTLISNFSNAGDLAVLEVNGGLVSTPKGLRFRLNKGVFAMPNNGIYLYSDKFMDFVPNTNLKSDFINSKLKGKNSCGWAAGQFNDGQYFTIVILEDPTSKQQFLAMEADAGGYYLGAAISGKIVIGGRNLCANP